MAGVIDIRENPAVGMAHAQAIGNIFSAIGRAEQLRQRKYQNDIFMKGIAEGKDPAQIVRDIQTASEAPRSKGLAGIGQMAGSVLAPKVDITEDLTNELFRQSIRRNDPLYQQQLEASKVNITGDKQRQEQSAGLYPGQVEGQGLQNQAVKQNITQDAEMQPGRVEGQGIQNQAAKKNLLYDQTKYEQSVEDHKLAVDRESRAKILDQLRIDGAIDDRTFEKEMQPLKKQALEAEITYRKAMANRPKAANAAAMNAVWNAVEQQSITPESLPRYQELARNNGYEIRAKTTVGEATPAKGGFLGIGKTPAIPGESVTTYEVVPVGNTQNNQQKSLDSSTQGGDTTAIQDGDLSKLSDEELLREIMNGK